MYNNIKEYEMYKKFQSIMYSDNIDYYYLIDINIFKFFISYIIDGAKNNIFSKLELTRINTIFFNLSNIKDKNYNPRKFLMMEANYALKVTKDRSVRFYRKELFKRYNNIKYLLGNSDYSIINEFHYERNSYYYDYKIVSDIQVYNNFDFIKKYQDNEYFNFSINTIMSEYSCILKNKSFLDKITYIMYAKNIENIKFKIKSRKYK